MFKLARLILTLISIFTVIGCGVKGPPLPPETYRDTEGEPIKIKKTASEVTESTPKPKAKKAK